MARLIRSGQKIVEQRQKALFYAHRNVVIYLNTLSRLDLVKFYFEGSPAQQPCIIMANHPSLLDFIIFLKDFPNAVCLYKTQTLDNPILSSFVQVAGYIQGMDGTPQASKRIISSCCERLREGHHVVIFPEGTRSKRTTEMHKFRTTGFHAAIKGDVPIQPVAIHCKPLLLGKNQSWSDFSQEMNRITVRYLSPIMLCDLSPEMQNSSGLSDMVKESINTALVELDS
ncbi:MAG: 1-acyl-sn-glycerol-3-phosphate acyltransferase [Candidatus Thiodiazotropha sp. (ex Lucinoma kastoroae)]|nr:1-acyl-sn-glycerol-3-phosphate acyltransferase [Candidatus Thiodiazotropha sp. (ex Lucinoma kastoroae)]MCU7861838.1 1-acyl-sn-glycerol-3-phosphate acyltransferase [Candidatus Thiodiazotropha sp. (ex Lucinoma kastoroae)]